jgi:3-oxoacyl-[acyl-carrier protein] reductase
LGSGYDIVFAFWSRKIYIAVLGRRHASPVIWIKERSVDLGIRGKKALVLGASQGMGAAIARAMAAEGCDLVIGARTENALAELAAELKSAHGVAAETYGIDLSDAAAVEILCAAIENEIKPDILLNNTGGPPPSGAIGVATDVWSRAFQSLFLSTVRITEAAVAGMRAKGWGRVLTIASSGVHQPIPNLAVSNSLRPSVVGFSKSLANEIAGDGVTVNVILPGRIETNRMIEIDNANAERQGLTVPELQAASLANIPAGRFGTAQEFAAVAAFLMSAPASYVTGSTIRVDGGAIKST